MNYEEYVENKYDFLDDIEKEVVIKRAKEIFFNTRYPFVDYDNRPVDIPFNYESWICRAIDELVERNNIAGAKTYAENGVNFTFDNTTVSLGLLSEIKPMVGGFDD